MATSIPTPSLNIKSAARKLPIKRKTPPQSSSDPNTPNPNPNPNPNFLPSDPYHDPSAIVTAYDDAEEDDDEYPEEEDDFEGGLEIGGGGEIIAPATGAGGGDLKPPPFKFHRIWSESDEIRFLQGLLGCWSQGMVFPRDLNLFYDRFCESMPQPYTRSQLSEKLRRLRKKFRIMSSRIARGQDPNRLAPHDRDLLHLCTRLWHPSYAASSPFAAQDSIPAGTTGNKRRRPNPRTPTGTKQRAVAAATAAVGDVVGPPPVLSAAPTALPPPVDTRNPVSSSEEEEDEQAAMPQLPPPPPAVALATVPASGTVVAGGVNMGKGDQIRYLAKKTVLDLFDESWKEVRSALSCNNENHVSSSSDLTKRWQEQRVAEMDVFACRLRLVLEQALHN